MPTSGDAAIAAIVELLGADHVDVGDDIDPDTASDESLGSTPQLPLAVVHPATTDEVAGIVRIAADTGTPVTARGSGTGLSGAYIPTPGGIVLAFDRMASILEVDRANNVAVVQPGVTLAQLDEVLGPMGLVYPVFPGENSASLGGNVNTNAGGMRAVKYGVTRHHVLGIEAVLGTGEIVRSGGKVVKVSSGYDLTQLVIGSEGTLAVVCEATLKVYPRPAFTATVLAPFETFDAVADAAPALVNSGVDPMIVEYIDQIAMAGIARAAGVDDAIPDDVGQRASAYLVVVLESHHDDRLEEDTATAARLLDDAGAIDVYVLPPGSGARLIEAREKTFWSAKAAGADDIIDVVVPRASVKEYLDRVRDIAAETGTFVAGCGHVGDGNVHFSILQPDDAVRGEVMHRILGAGVDLGGAISGEHGIGQVKRDHFLEFAGEPELALERRIKAAFDPAGILNPAVAR